MSETTTETITFGDLQIAFDDRVLRPRPWTLAQSRLAARLLETAPAGPVLELCSGAGQIGLAAVAASDRRLVCVDADAVACEYARSNVERAGLADRVEVRHGRLETALAPDERFAVVIADPPWVPREEITRYPEDPVTAIDGGPDGLDVARACLRVVAGHLLPGGSAVLQLGTAAQAERLAAETTGSAPHLRLAGLEEHPRGVLAHLAADPSRSDTQQRRPVAQ